MKRRLWALLVGPIFLLHGSASAQEVALKQGESITKVMQEADCDRAWLVQVIADSGINPRRLRQLPIGQKIVLTACKGGTPPAHVASLSETLLRMDLNVGQAQNLATEITALRTTANAAIARAESANTENAELKLWQKQLEGELQKAKAEATASANTSKAAPSATNSWLIAIGGGLIGLMLGIGLSYIAFMMWEKKRTSFQTSFRTRRVIKKDGKAYEFVLVGATQTGSDVVGVYKCPLCFERNLHGREENFVKHIDTHPAEQRVIEENSAFPWGNEEEVQQVRG